MRRLKEQDSEFAVMPTHLQKVYTEVPPTYEFLNHLLTLGLDINWRKKAARMAAIAKGTHWLDVGIGTGEMAANLHLLAPESTQVIALDFSLPMMRRALEKPEAKGINFILAEAVRLPFQDGSFDAITFSFACRNVDSSGKGNITRCYEELYRILKSGGILVNLETSQPKHKFIRRLFHLYVELAVHRLGRMVSGSKAAYSYLARSMRGFYSPEELADIMLQAGFSEVSFKRLLLGAAAIHRAKK
ncbi:MAG: ubiquinone/menaquinone biosynthesis methyltransferase [Dehalococcoidia bacterium]